MVESSDSPTISIESKAVNLLSHLIGTDGLPSSEAIAGRGWSALPVALAIGPMDAEWLANGILLLGENAALGISYEDDGAPHVSWVSANRDAITKFHDDHTGSVRCLTTPGGKFLCWTARESNFYLLCGSRKFLAAAHPISRETALQMFVGDIAPIVRRSTPEFEDGLSLWRRYAPDQDIDEWVGQMGWRTDEGGQLVHQDLSVPWRYQALVTAGDSQDDASLDSVALTFHRRFIGGDHLPTNEAIAAKGWQVIPVDSRIGPMDAEWLSNAIVQSGARDVFGIHFEYNGTPVAVPVATDRNSVAEFLHEYSYAYTCITTPDARFLNWNDADFYLLCGHPDFLAAAHPISRETAAHMYVESAVLGGSSQAYEHTLALWRRYAPDQDIEGIAARHSAE